MSVHRRWNPTDLAKAAGVSVNQIYAWYREGQLNGEINERGVLRLPLIEAVAVYALRDGQDPQKARDDLMAGRLGPFEHTPRPLTNEEREDLAESFRLKHNLPHPVHYDRIEGTMVPKDRAV